MNIRGLDDIRKKREEEEEEIKRQRESYVGGESSGQSVLDPRLRAILEQYNIEEVEEKDDPFKGAGTVLDPHHKASPASPQSSVDALLAATFPHDPSLPKHELGLRLSSGVVKRIEVTPATKLSEVRLFLKRYLTAPSIKLFSTYPRRDLTALDSTLGELDLLDAIIDVHN